MSDCSIDILIKKLELIIKNKKETLLVPIIVDNKDLEKYIIERLVNINSGIILCDAFSNDNFLDEFNNLLKSEFSCITNISLYFRKF